jgi:hypothetical protein
MSDEIDLDALLESALEDFSKEPETPVPPVALPQFVPSSGSRSEEPDMADLLQNPMKALTSMLADPKMKEEFERDFGGMLREMEGEGGASESFSLDNLQKELESFTKAMGEAPSVPRRAESPSEGKREAIDSSEEADALASTLKNLLDSAKELQGVRKHVRPQHLLTLCTGWVGDEGRELYGDV